MSVAYQCLCLQVLVIVCRRVTSGDVFASSAHLRMLDDGERDLIRAVKSYVRDTRVKMELLEKLIREVEDNRVCLGDSVIPVSHPIDSLRLIRRFTTTWNDRIFPLISDAATAKEVDNLRQSMEDLIPTEEDYDGAKTSLLRLQHTYSLPVSDLINGTILGGRRTKPLSQQMVVEISLYAFRRKLTDDALAWLTHAQNHLEPPLVPQQEIYHASARIHAQKGELLQASMFTTKALELDPSNKRFLMEIMPNSSSNLPAWSPTESEEDKLCSEFVIENRLVPNTEAICRFERGRVVPFEYRKVEYLSLSPEVVIFHDFITDGDANRLIHLGNSKIQRALVGSVHGHFKTEQRVAKTAWLYDNSGEPLVDKISRRIGDFTGLEVTGDLSSEPLQLGNYGIGGLYASHYDYFSNRFEEKNLKELLMKEGDRIATLMIYLSNVEAGGATIFPEIDLGTRPIKNAAIFWYNYKRSGHPETKMLHAGCPVLIGDKWVANKWIHEFDQLFKRPCDLKMDA